MTIAIYARVSDDKLTTDGERRQDIDRQVDKLMKVAEIYQFGTPVVFKDDNKTAFKEDYNSRPEFLRMLREIRAHRIQRVLIESLDRWSRRVEDGIKTLREASESGCTVTSAAEGECDTTLPEGWFKTTLAFMMAEWSSRSLSFKVKSGMERRMNNKDKICPTCGIVHLGRHPATCECPNCMSKKGRAKK